MGLVFARISLTDSQNRDISLPVEQIGLVEKVLQSISTDKQLPAAQIVLTTGRQVRVMQTVAQITALSDAKYYEFLNAEAGLPTSGISGTYTPTRSAETNLDSNIVFTEAQYCRVGNTVIASGRFTANPTTTATPTSFEGTLPIASNLGAAEDVGGGAFCGAIASQGAELTGVAANDTFKVSWNAVDVTSQTWSYWLIYQVI